MSIFLVKRSVSLKVASTVHKNVCMFNVKIYKGLVSVRIKKNNEKEDTMLSLKAYYAVAVVLDCYDFETVFCQNIKF